MVVASRKFKINTKPYDDSKVYKRSSIELHSGLTVLVGCNGSGKSTLLNTLKRKLKKADIPVFYFDNVSEGSYTSRNDALYQGDMNFVALSWTSSEGENLILNLKRMSKCIKEFLKSGKVSKSGLEDVFYKLFTDKPEEIKKDEFWVLLDAIDSGLSIDSLVDLRDLFLGSLVRHTNTLNVPVYIVVSANNYELCVGNSCFDVTSGKYVNITSYNDYKKHILKSREYKNKRYGVPTKEET